MNTEDVNETIAWHFTGSTLRDGSPVPDIGQTLIFPDKIAIDKAGYHWSRQPAQALLHAPGPFLHKVSFGGKVIEKDNRGVSSERTILASIDASHLLHRFAADQALSVAHLWNMPDIVREYLTTLDESKRDAARVNQWACRPNVGSKGPTFRNAWRAAWETLVLYNAYDAAISAAWDAAMTRMRTAVILNEFNDLDKHAGAVELSAWEDMYTTEIGAAWAEFNRRVYNAFQIELA